MEKRKPWQLVVILLAVALTLINILPTVFYYAQPLKEPVDQELAETVATDVVSRVNTLEEESLDWVRAYAKNLGIYPQSIALVEENPSLIEVKLSNQEEVSLFQRFLKEAGGLIPFPPAQLAPPVVATGADELDTVYVQRRVGMHLDPTTTDELFQFGHKSVDGQITPFYRKLIHDRVTQLALELGGTTRHARLLDMLADKTPNNQQGAYLTLAKEIVGFEKSFREQPELLQRLFASFSQSNSRDAEASVHRFMGKLETLKSGLAAQRDALQKTQQEAVAEQGFGDSDRSARIDELASQAETLDTAITLLRKHTSWFTAGQDPLTVASVSQQLSQLPAPETGDVQELSLAGRHPLIRSLAIDWSNETVQFELYEDVAAVEESTPKSESEAILKDRLHQLLIDDIARLQRLTEESVASEGPGDYVVHLNALTNSNSFLVLDLGEVAKDHTEQLLADLRKNWQPQSADLSGQQYPIWDYDTYQALPPVEQRLGLVVYAPAAHDSLPMEGLRSGSIYVIARGLNRIQEKYDAQPGSADAQQFYSDTNDLVTQLQQQGFVPYAGNSVPQTNAFAHDIIFELDGYYQSLLMATREDFVVRGSHRFAVLEFTDVEQRLHTSNRIDDQAHEDLLKWKEEYNRAQVALDATQKYKVPAPTKNSIWENFKLSAKKYFRGDARKILKWGLDLSGGKTVRIALLDQNNREVTSEEDLNRAVNELYSRINSMGVSEQTIRIEGKHILVEFPGSQGVSASELIQGSAMTFHIVNEKFSIRNPALADATEQFLQAVWNEAVVTNRKDAESLQQIAWEQLGGDPRDGRTVRPQTEYAKLLYENGLRLAGPDAAPISEEFDNSLSAVARQRGDTPTEWNHSHPLMFVFRNYALEGSSLYNVRAAYDPGRGNTIPFEVSSSYSKKRTDISAEKSGRSPRNDFYAWTSQYSKTAVEGTELEAYSAGDGWRMAIVLNGEVISAPRLSADLSSNGEIQGQFTQREINRLVADLRAGSLSFTPKILSETNISADLGKQERVMGIGAAMLGLLLVVIVMSSYYRFAGIIASVAVLFNLFIMWGVLQNLDAALTLPGLAGIILTVGMAVDANVLVFERIREEFANSGRIASAIQAGYRKAFSAIIDSNVTTIIAALILLQFDAGPIKGFAVTLIIGIISSMFTALFMTRYFFAGWAQNPNNKELRMHDWIGKPNFSFLPKAKFVAMVSAVLITLGGYLLVEEQSTIFGMEFTGGYSMTVELEEQPDNPNYRELATDSLLSAGAVSTDFQVKRLNKPNQLNIQFGMGVEEQGRIFHGMEETLTEETFVYDYQKNPRLNWVVDALQHGGLDVRESQLEDLHQNWSSMSSQFSDAMRNHALYALGFAMIAILVYITFRFEFKFAVAAIVALTHDVLISLGTLALLHKFGAPLQITMEIVGALMTIIGYSLNDTIIIFDRIREDMRLMRKLSFPEIIEHALNTTLSRTLMTSGTTMLVLLALVVFGGSAIFAFAFIMLIGVLFGTMSSLFIASPVMLWLHNREVEREQQALTQS